MLQCTTIPKDGVTVTWEKDDLEIPLYPATGIADKSVVYVLSNKSLYIRSLRRRHTGTYTCTASSGLEKRFAKVVVEMACKNYFIATLFYLNMMQCLI